MDQTAPQPEGAAENPQTAQSVPPSSETNAPTAPEGHSPTLMGVLAYIGPLVIIPFLLAKDDLFVRFHVKQGLVLLIIELIVWVLQEQMMWAFLTPITMLINLVLLILSIIGIINVLQEKEKRLPLVGAYADHIKI